MSSWKQVDQSDGPVTEVQLLVRVPWFQRWDVFPFAILYTSMFWILYSPLVQLALGGVPAVLLLHVVLFLLSQWSTSLKCKIGHRAVSSVKQASHLHVVVPASAGRSKIAPLQSLSGLSVAGSRYALMKTRFEFQEVVYEFDDDRNLFVRQAFPVVGPVSGFLAHTGYDNDVSFAMSLAKWGPNGMLCRRRQAGVQVLRSMRRPPTTIQVYRNSKWDFASTESLLPGDINITEECTIPVDAMLIRGSCVVSEAMLTGESVPQLKESLQSFEKQGATIDLRDNQGDVEWKRHLVFSGTSLVQDTPGDGADAVGIPLPPQGGCTAVVLRTGFGTTQGGLMRKILFAAERLSATSSETGYFIGVLVLFALIASLVVLNEGLRDESRNKFKLVLHCIMIVTSVIPPELPMELSLAVTNSLNELGKNLVFCTEPFRIPLAGKLDTLCFDKTGTLTTDRMELRGVAGQVDVPLIDLNADFLGTVPPAALAVMAVCNSLFQTGDGTIQGDPLEVATLKASGFTHPPNEGNVVGANQSFKGLTNAARGLTITRLMLYPFTSALKRMSVIALIQQRSGDTSSSTSSHPWVLTKGAPEILADMITGLPTDYRKVYREHMNRGRRVLALAGKPLVFNSSKQVSREEAENSLHFFGFLVYDCDLKADTRGVIKELRQSDHNVMMITGDSPHTAADIGRRLSFLRKDKPLRVLRKVITESGDAIETSLNTDVALDTTVGALVTLSDSCDLSTNLCPYVRIFARVSPVQKEEILLALNDNGRYTLMCGDGTNDVGALKAAHVGVSIVNNPDFESSVESTATKKSANKGSSAKDRMNRALAELQKQEADPTIVKLGDASIASPFTARRTSIDSVLTVMRQGRCTLVMTIQIFKLLALNCLVSAYMMTALYLRGLKQGDFQMTANGIVTAGLFFFLSLAKPVGRIATTKPTGRK
eukprot:GSChrysophyteH1.ASY1.ANO1.711.1 assembled CDS